MNTDAPRLLLGLTALLLNTSVPAAEWGTLKGRLVVEGQPPVLEELTLGNDAFCQHAKPVNETVVVGDDGGLAHAVVYLRARRGEAVAVHPDYGSLAAEPVELVNLGCRFEPRVTLLLTGQKLLVKNADPTAHNTKFDLVRNEAFNSVIPAKEALETEFGVAEPLPTPVSCNIHPFMRGYLLVRDDPYMAVTGADGRFEIANLPAGEHQFQFWHESGYLKGAAFGEGEADKRGRTRLMIPAGGVLDLGDIRVPAELLAR